MDFDKMDFVVAGPGARDGIRKCFGPSSGRGRNRRKNNGRGWVIWLGEQP